MQFIIQNLGLASLLVGLVATGRWFLLAWRVDIPRNPTLFRLAWGAGLVLGIAALVLATNDGFAPWGVGVGIVLLYLSFTGAQRADGALVDVGDAMPAFAGVDDTGAEFDSASLVGSRVLLKFFRGHW